MNLLGKINSQPDLQDVSSYLLEPLIVLDSLVKKIEDKWETNNVRTLLDMQIYRKLSNIVNVHLPKLIDNYCELSIDYRNAHIVKKGHNKKENLTAKDVLLVDLSHIITEIRFIEQEYNEITKNELLVNSRFIKRLTTESNTSLEPEKLANTFNYPLYKKNNKNNFILDRLFKKEKKEEVSAHLPKQYVEGKIEKILVDFSPFLAVFAFVSLGAWCIYDRETSLPKYAIIHNVENITKYYDNELWRNKLNTTYNISAISKNSPLNDVTYTTENVSGKQYIKMEHIPVSTCETLTKKLFERDYKVSMNGKTVNHAFFKQIERESDLTHSANELICPLKNNKLVIELT